MTAKILYSATLSALLSLSSMAEEKLKLELLAPEKPVVIDKNQLQKATAKQGILLTYRITNLSDDDMVLEFGGDSVINLLEIKGAGAVNVPFQGPMTLDFHLGTSFTLKPGMSKEFTINDLSYGARNKSRWRITEEGDYEVTLTHKIIRAGGANVELKSNTAKFSVATK